MANLERPIPRRTVLFALGASFLLTDCGPKEKASKASVVAFMDSFGSQVDTVAKNRTIKSVPYSKDKRTTITDPHAKLLIIRSKDDNRILEINFSKTEGDITTGYRFFYLNGTSLTVLMFHKKNKQETTTDKVYNIEGGGLTQEEFDQIRNKGTAILKGFEK